MEKVGMRARYGDADEVIRARRGGRWLMEGNRGKGEKKEVSQER